ncbi:MAG: hypothetical protein K6G91_08170, partial [Kiritimatiellae bacterium]|nr:hypothetical protein [Kiritimatiellia bacterium]
MLTAAEYEGLVPREATPSSGSRLFSFTRHRTGTSDTRFLPGAARLHFANRDADTLEALVPSGFLLAGDLVSAQYKGVTVFKGEVDRITRRAGRGLDSTDDVVCVGPWAKMSRLVYRQNWMTGGGLGLSSRLVLNQTYQIGAQTLDDALYEVASHGASACGYTVAQAAISVSSQVLPSDECRDLTVADAIRRELRFFPKAICRFDYSGASPALHIEETATPATASYAASVPKSRRETTYTAHPVTGVDLEIDSTGTVDGVEYHTIGHQTAGNTSAGNPDCLYATLQIRGESSDTVRHSFKSVTEDIPQNLADVGWWKARHPRLANVASNAITITEASRSPSNYPRISANTAGDLEAAGIRCEVTKFTCKATISTTDDTEEDVYLTMQYLTTNATGTAANPKTYTWVAESSAESGETVPEGLAAALLAERSGTLLAEKFVIRLGDALPQLGDALVEDEGTVFLQSFDVDCATLTAELSFGVPDYLAPEDMASLLSGFRNKSTTSSSVFRKTGKKEDGGRNVRLGAIPPLSSTEFAPGTKAKTTIGSASGSGGKIELDSSKVGSGKKIEVRTLTVKKSGEDDKTYKVLADVDITVGGGAGGGVESVNSADGALAVIGGEGVRVTTRGRTIMITASADKTEADDDPNYSKDPCEPHPGASGGVLPGVGDDDEEHLDYGSSAAAGGGVPGGGAEGTG